jgi:hypothetical protein
VNKALHEYLDVFVTAYLDDVLVYSKGSLKEYINYVKKVLGKLREYKLLLNLEKYEFHVIEIDYLRFIILRDSITIDLAKV